MSQYVDHNRQNVQEFQSAKGFVKPVREWYPPTAVPNPEKCPKNLRKIHTPQYYSPMELLEQNERGRWSHE